MKRRNSGSNVINAGTGYNEEYKKYGGLRGRERERMRRGKWRDSETWGFNLGIVPCRGPSPSREADFSSWPKEASIAGFHLETDAR